MENKLTFTIIDEDNKEYEYEIIMAFYWSKTKKNYLVYTDNTKDELGNIRVYANTFDEDDESGELGTIETDEEWATIEQIFASINNNKKEGE